jgi:hypothetical protein
VYDGSEIHEASSVLVHLTREGAVPQCYAPDILQLHVINHNKVLLFILSHKNLQIRLLAVISIYRDFLERGYFLTPLLLAYMPKTPPSSGEKMSLMS